VPRQIIFKGFQIAQQEKHLPKVFTWENSLPSKITVSRTQMQRILKIPSKSYALQPQAKAELVKKQTLAMDFS